MKHPHFPLHERLKKLLDLPSKAKPSDVSDCVFSCLSDALNCRFVRPRKLPGATIHYRAAWLAPSGMCYEGHGKTGAEAGLAAALNLISECEEAALLRCDSEPEFAQLEVRAPRQRSSNGRGSHSLTAAARIRRAGSAE